MREHLRNLSLGWVAFGWFIAVAITSLLLLAVAALGLAVADTPGEAVWVGATLVIGFFTSGYFVGTRVAAAPTLNGLGMGVFSLVAWLLVNVLLGEPIGDATWRALEPGTLIGLLGLQAVAAIAGCRFGVHWTRTPPGEH